MIHESTSLTYEPASLPQHISVMWLFLHWQGRWVTASRPHTHTYAHTRARTHTHTHTHTHRGDGRQPPGRGLGVGLLLVFDPRQLSMRLQLSDTRVHEPQTRARLVTTAHFCKVNVSKWAGEMGDSLPAVPRSLSLARSRSFLLALTLSLAHTHTHTQARWVTASRPWTGRGASSCF